MRATGPHRQQMAALAHGHFDRLKWHTDSAVIARGAPNRTAMPCHRGSAAATEPLMQSRSASTP